MLTYRLSFETKQQAEKFVSTLIHGGVIQQQESRWHVWQCNC